MSHFERTWADRCAEAYAEKPTPARAGNAAQCLRHALAEIDRLNTAIADLVSQRNRHAGIETPGYYLTDAGLAATEPGVPMPTRQATRRGTR